MNIAQAKCIPLAAYLERQGHQPQRSRQNGRELWYYSPIRDGDENPSFKVDTIKNLWFDHGAARGGTIIDLARDLCACDVRDALQHLERTGLYSPALSKPSTTEPASRQNRPSAADHPNRSGSNSAGEKEKSGPLELVSEGPLKHPALLQYIEARGIHSEIASSYLSQIDFKAPQSPGTYFGVGHPAGDGFEARNALFKGFVGTRKEISFHEGGDAPLLMIFEGFMDFLSYLTANGLRQAPGSVLVLNSTNLWRRALPYIEDPRFEEIHLYLDNDDAGDAVTKRLFEHLVATSKLTDMRRSFAEYEDLNAWLLAQRS